jgi:hypothetical protein
MSATAMPAQATFASRRPRIVAVPASEPPYDDDPEMLRVHRRRNVTGTGLGGRDAVEGTLALAFDLPTGVPAEPAAPALPARLRLVHGSADDEDADFAPRPTGRAFLPDPRVWSGRLVQAVVEVIGGLRPAAQLVRWTSAEVYSDISDAIGPQHLAPAARVRAAVKSVHVCEPADGVAEVCAVVQRGPRAQAVAVRLEGVDGRWLCTSLTLC